MLIPKINQILRPRLAVALMMAFSVLVIPPLLLIVGFSNYQTDSAIRRRLDAELARTQVQTVSALGAFFRPIISATGVIANVAVVNPATVREESFNEVLYRTLSGVDHISGITITFEDGSWRNFARVTPEVRKAHPEYPAEAQFVARMPSKKVVGNLPSLEAVLYDRYPHVIATMPPTHSPDFLDAEAYIGARGSEEVFITNVSRSPASGLPRVSVAYPMKSNGEFSGAVTMDIRLDEISTFLRNNRISENSELFILAQDGQIIAASALGSPVSINPLMGPGSTSIDIEPLHSRLKIFNAVEEGSLPTDTSREYSVHVSGVEYAVSNFGVKNALGLNYEALIVTPLSDFVGGLQRSRRDFLLLIFIILSLVILLMVRTAQKMSGRIRHLSMAVGQLRQINFEPTPWHNSTPPPIEEVAELDRGISLLQSTLRSLSLYLPLGVVKQLIDSGKPITPGVERRELTILFCDLENFSTMAYDLSTEELLHYTSAYFGVATQAVARHTGTVDKFIGDAVMAFWGAPHYVSNHAELACRAALDIVNGIEALNRDWAAQGKRTLRVRVGINSASVLVGNLGSQERLSYTALGDGVNVASRLEAKNKELGSTICISDTTFERAKDWIVAHPIRPVTVRGRPGEFMVYELVGIVDRDQKVQTERVTSCV